MAKFIEITPTICVNVDNVEWIESVNEGMSSVIRCRDKEYPCEVPYHLVIDLLQQSDSSDKHEKVMQKLDNYLSVAPVTVL